MSLNLGNGRWHSIHSHGGVLCPSSWLYFRIFRIDSLDAFQELVMNVYDGHSDRLDVGVGIV